MGPESLLLAISKIFNGIIKPAIQDLQLKQVANMDVGIKPLKDFLKMPLNHTSLINRV